MNAPPRRALLLFELTASLGSGALGLTFGVLVLREQMNTGFANSASAVLFLACAALAPLVVAVGTWRHARNGEPGWGRAVGLAALFLIAFSFFGGPVLIAAALAALMAVVLFGTNARLAGRETGRGRVLPGSF